MYNIYNLNIVMKQAVFSQEHFIIVKSIPATKNVYTLCFIITREITCKFSL